MELKNVHWQYLANKMSLFALNTQTYWLVFASLVITVVFWSLTKLEEVFQKIMCHKNSLDFPESSDIFGSNKYFELTQTSQVFKIQFFKPILKHVTSNLITWKQQFYEQFEIFFITKYNYDFKIFRGTFTYKLTPRKHFIKASKYQKYTNFIENCPKMTTFNFSCIGRKLLKRKLL